MIPLSKSFKEIKIILFSNTKIFRYFIYGSVNTSISVDILTGEIRTLIDGTFDYERQTELLIQVQARDTLQTMNEPIHTTFTQVRIEVIDVNDTPPVLKMVSL